MRRARLTWEGAFHHLMNRGIEGGKIFFDDELKEKFLRYLSKGVEKYKIRLFSYCIMDNHYHLVLENSSGRLSEFMRELNGSYGQFYRKKLNSAGYVFQGRYKSTIIEDESYLTKCISYVLQNPVRASYCKRAVGYVWSSVNLYFSNSTLSWIDSRFVEEIFGSRDQLISMINKKNQYGSKVKQTSWGGIFGDEGFLVSAVRRFDRRVEKESLERKRYDDFHFESVDKVIHEFEKRIGHKIDGINTGTSKGKKLRGELLVRLKDSSGLKYREIARMDLFSDLRSDSLRSIYRNSKRQN